jgi:hypothetical protein
MIIDAAVIAAGLGVARLIAEGFDECGNLIIEKDSA